MKAFTPELEARRTAFLESLRIRNQAPATLKSRRGAISTFFRWMAGADIEDVREVTREHVRSYQIWLAGRSLSTHTLHVKLIGLRRFFEHLESTDAVLLNPCLGLILPKFEDRLPRLILTTVEVEQLLNAPDTKKEVGLRDKAILEMFYSTGIRLEEMAGLAIHDVDWRNGFVRVTCGKFAKDRVVPMGSKAAQYVREYLEKVRRLWEQADPENGDGRDERALWLTSIKPHRPLKSQMIQVMVKRYARAIGMGKTVSPHVWRHTCATHLLSNGANLMHIRQLLGHRSLKTTQIYTRVSPCEMKAAHRRAHPRSRIK